MYMYTRNIKPFSSLQVNIYMFHPQISASDFAAYKDIPDYIPQLLVVGTPVTGMVMHTAPPFNAHCIRMDIPPPSVLLLSVTARLHTERESGFYTGRIEAVDLDNHQYWVTFDRPGLGKHSIHDTEIRVYTVYSTCTIYYVHVYTCTATYPYILACIMI